MIEVSMITTNWAMAMIASAHQRRGSGVDEAMAGVLSEVVERSPGISRDAGESNVWADTWMPLLGGWETALFSGGVPPTDATPTLPPHFEAPTRCAGTMSRRWARARAPTTSGDSSAGTAKLRD